MTVDLSASQKNRLSRAALERFPVTPGSEHWIGPHLVTCYDLETHHDQVVRAANSLPPAPPALLYTDPPWGQANASSFRRKADLEGAANYVAFRRALCRIIAELGAPAVVEMGLRWVNDWRYELQNLGCPVVHVVQGTYYRTKPMAYIIVAPRPLAHRLGAALTGVDDDRSPGYAIDTVAPPPGSVIFDPCCGRGLTARYTVSRGHHFLGNELAPYRAAATLAFLDEAAHR